MPISKRKTKVFVPPPATPGVPFYRKKTVNRRRYAEVTADNNFGERQVRPAVILRKNSPSNRSERGATTQAVLMSVYRTLKLRGLNRNETIAAALRTYVTTGQLPALARFQDVNRG
jgi:hypothetical protein